MLEVTEKCNLTCPMCYAGSNPDGRHYTLEEIEQRLDEIVAAEGPTVCLQISGGEPSVRKDLKELAALIKSKGFTNFEMISNGIRIARDADFAESLKDVGLHLRLFAVGLAAGVGHRTLARREIARCPPEGAGATGEGGAEHDAGRLAPAGAEYRSDRADSGGLPPASDHPRRLLPGGDAVRQPLGCGRASARARSDTRGFGRKLRLPDILQLIEEQLGIPPEEFMPLGFGSPLCNSIAILRHDKKRGTWVPDDAGHRVEQIQPDPRRRSGGVHPHGDTREGRVLQAAPLPRGLGGDARPAAVHRAGTPASSSTRST